MKAPVVSFLAAVVLASSVPASHAERVYPEYKPNETLLFRSGLVEVEGKGDQRKATERPDEYGVKQYRIPHLTRTPSGHLVLAVVGRCSKGGDGGKSTTFFAVSKDEGKNWSYVRHNTDYENPEGRPATDFPLTERTQETQVVYYPMIKRFVAVYLTRKGVWVTTSRDLKVWTTPTKAEFHADEIMECWPSPASLTVDDDGSLLFAITGSERVDGTKRRFARLVWTKDLENFEVSPSMPVKGNETAVAPLGDGTYFVTTRIGPKRLNMYYNREARTWTEPTPFPQPHTWRCEVDVINHEGTLYLSTPTKGRTKGTIYKSTDRGGTWSKVVQVNDDYYAYSSLVMLENGNLGLVAERAYRRDKEQPVLTDIVFHEIPLP